jgi:hypothetical protein
MQNFRQVSKIEGFSALTVRPELANFLEFRHFDAECGRDSKLLRYWLGINELERPAREN